MRAEHLAFPRIGCTVCAAATCFDKPDELRYSEIRFGDQWETATMIGRVRRVLNGACLVQWDDAELREVNFEHIELHGDTLRAAETRISLQKQANMENSGGGSRRSTRIVPRKTNRRKTKMKTTMTSHSTVFALRLLRKADRPRRHQAARELEV